MLGVIYIIMAMGIGVVFCKAFFPQLFNSHDYIQKDGTGTQIPAIFVIFPAVYLTGILFTTWTAYLFSYVFKGNSDPMRCGNLLTFIIGFAIIVLYYLKTRKTDYTKKALLSKKDMLTAGKPVHFVFAGIVLIYSIVLMYKTFYCTSDEVKVGFSVWADFGAHLSMIRSFSFGNNFPTGYAYFGGEDIRYHFMHEFLVGNLEYLGLRLDHAFNIPSILSFVSVYFLLYALTIRLFGKNITAFLAGVLFSFRSSPSAIRFMLDDESGHPVKALLNNTAYFTYSEYHEGWGFWCTRVFCNQRHFAFGITALLLGVYLFLPYLEAMGNKLKKLRLEGIRHTVYKGVLKDQPVLDAEGNEVTDDEGNPVIETVETLEEDGFENAKPGFFDYIKSIFFSKDCFDIFDLKFSIGAGLFLGALGFWHGSALIATLGMLFFMAAFSCHRIDYLIAALLSVALALLQSKFFIFGQAVEPKIYLGFLAEEKTPEGIVKYIFALTGITLILAMIGMFMARKGVSRYMLLVCMVPFVLSFVLSLTPDIGVNHKWVIISLMLTAMFTAYALTPLFEVVKGKLWLTTIKYAVGFILVGVLTITGFSELLIQAKEDTAYWELDRDAPLTMWLKDNTTSEDLILSNTGALNDMVMAGVMQYYAYPYCSWSAGYDTGVRETRARQMFSARSSSELAYLCRLNDIDYIIIDPGVRDEYKPDEELFCKTFKTVYQKDEGYWSVIILDTHQLIYK